MFDINFLVSIHGASKEAAIGDEVSALGYPDFSMDSEFHLAELRGRITTKHKYKGMEIVVTDMLMQTGISGGPILNNKSELIGMACLGNDELIVSEVQNGFIPAEYIDTLINKYKSNSK